jgi:translation initiation factor IF-2
MEAKNKITMERAPIVTILGHVDHGKTTLLDTIRKTSVAAKEAGGITQNIGASQVVTKDGKHITFIDTPGHAAFSKMRSRGAKVADIVILVVAADDGVAPQTKEAISHIKEANIPFIVAVTKVDLATANVEATLGQLEKEGIYFEKRGGDTPWVGVSAKTKIGLDELLATISLLAEVNEIKADPNGELEAVVIETTKDRRGPVANVVIRNGTLKVGDTVYTESGSAKIRSLISDKGQVKEVLPGEPAQILGFEILPEVGSKIASFEFEKKDEKKNGIIEVGEHQIGILIKAQNAGSLEAVLANIPPEVVVVSSGVGDIYESDVLSAKSNGAVRIFAFDSKVASQVKKLAEAEGIEIQSFKIIYELLQTLEEIIKKGKTVINGKAEVVASFPFNNKKIAGCKLLSGVIGKGDKLILMRGEKELGKVRIISLRKQKTEMTQAKQGEEFGILFEPQLDFAVGDVLVSVAK